MCLNPPASSPCVRTARSSHQRYASQHVAPQVRKRILHTRASSTNTVHFTPTARRAVPVGRERDGRISVYGRSGPASRWRSLRPAALCRRPCGLRTANRRCSHHRPKQKSVWRSCPESRPNRLLWQPFCLLTLRSRPSRVSSTAGWRWFLAGPAFIRSRRKRWRAMADGGTLRVLLPKYGQTVGVNVKIIPF